MQALQDLLCDPLLLGTFMLVRLRLQQYENRVEPSELSVTIETQRSSKAPASTSPQEHPRSPARRTLDASVVQRYVPQAAKRRFQGAVFILLAMAARTCPLLAHPIYWMCKQRARPSCHGQAVNVAHDNRVLVRVEKPSYGQEPFPNIRRGIDPGSGPQPLSCLGPAWDRETDRLTDRLTETETDTHTHTHSHTISPSLPPARAV